MYVHSFMHPSTLFEGPTFNRERACLHHRRMTTPPSIIERRASHRMQQHLIPI
jgi:hypothetical protein